MKDSRIANLRAAFDGVVESLDATVRIGRWNGPDPVPGPLQQSAAMLIQRLAAADRASNCRLTGSVEVAKKLSSIRAAIQRLDQAYVEYRRHIDGTPAEIAEAEATLDLQICSARNDALAGP